MNNSDKEDSDEENSNEKNFPKYKKIFFRKI